MLKPFDIGRLKYRRCPCGAWLGARTDEERRKIIEIHESAPRHIAWLKGGPTLP